MYQMLIVEFLYTTSWRVTKGVVAWLEKSAVCHSSIGTLLRESNF